MQRYIIFMLDVYARPPPPASAGNVLLDKGISPYIATLYKMRGELIV
jgi:hypothetical protein